MRKKLASLAAAVALVGASLFAPPAQGYEAGFSVYVDATSVDGVNMLQSYSNEWVGVSPGHWNMDYGNKYNPQSVNSILLLPGKCIKVFKLNAARNGWVTTGWVGNRTTSAPYWVDTSYPGPYSAKFTFDWNRVILRNYQTYRDRGGFLVNECAAP